MFKYAIFDADGTLFDSMHIWDGLGEKYLLARGLVPKEKFDEKACGLSLMESAEYLKKEYFLPDSPEEIVDGFCALIKDFYFNDVLPKECVVDFLSKLKEYGVKMCIATSSDKRMIEGALKRNNMSDYFEFILTANEVGAGKSRPGIYITALEMLGAEINSSVVFEDAAHAAITAKNAGFIVCGVYDKSEENFPIDKVDYFINTFDEAIKLFFN